MEDLNARLKFQINDGPWCIRLRCFYGFCEFHDPCQCGDPRISTTGTVILTLHAAWRLFLCPALQRTVISQCGNPEIPASGTTLFTGHATRFFCCQPSLWRTVIGRCGDSGIPFSGTVTLILHAAWGLSLCSIPRRPTSDSIESESTANQNIITIRYWMVLSPQDHPQT